MFAALRSEIDHERRVSLGVLITARWLLAAAATFTVVYRPGIGTPRFFLLLGLIGLAVLLNVWLLHRLSAHRPIRLGLPVLAGAYDVAAITGAIALVDGFDNTGFLLYYPALLAIGVVFPGRLTLLYTGVTMLAYVAVTTIGRDGFDPGAVADQKMLVMRLATMASVALIANVVVRIERQRRERAVAAEAARATEVLALEQRATAAERAARDERRRLSREVHDGISQGAYMLALGLETVGELAARDPTDPRVPERLGALVRLAKQTLLETRHLLYDLEGVMAGQTSLVALLQKQAEEFSAVTGIGVAVTVEGAERPLPAADTGEVYRVVQESLANVYKHAGASAAAVRLAYGPDAITLEVADNGRGFDTAAERTRGLGLRGMYERAAGLGGAVKVESAPGSGARVRLSIPMREGPA